MSTGSQGCSRVGMRSSTPYFTTESGSSLAAGFPAGRLKKPHRRNPGLRHLTIANSQRVVDCDFAIHASDSLLHCSVLRWNWRSRSLCGCIWNTASLQPGVAAAVAARGSKTAVGLGAHAEPCQRRLGTPFRLIRNNIFFQPVPVGNGEFFLRQPRFDPCRFSTEPAAEAHRGNDQKVKRAPIVGAKLLLEI